MKLQVAHTRLRGDRSYDRHRSTRGRYAAHQAELKQLQARMAEAEALYGQEAPATRSYNRMTAKRHHQTLKPSNPYDTAFIDHASN